MGIFDKVREFINAEDVDDYNENDYDDYDDYEDMPVTPQHRPYAEREHSEQKKNKVVNINGSAQLQVILVKPDSFNDARNIADHLKSKKTVVLNLESTNKDVSRRLVDFLSGVAYANNGDIQRVATSTFIITPYNVDIMGDLIDGIGSAGAEQ